MKQYDASTELWNKTFSECELKDLTGDKLEVEPMFDTCLEIFAKESRRVLDFGCGTGDILFQCADYGAMLYGMGIDRSEKGIDYCIEMANINHYRQLDFVQGDITYVSQMEDGCFDGIILSNVLDVTPKDVGNDIFTELTRLLKEGGLMFLKLNPYANENKLIDYGMTCIKDNLYEKDGVLRLRNQDTDTWKEEFETDYIIERYLEFPYPWQEGMNRLFLLRKKNHSLG